MRYIFTRRDSRIHSGIRIQAGGKVTMTIYGCDNTLSRSVAVADTYLLTLASYIDARCNVAAPCRDVALDVRQLASQLYIP